MFLDRVEGTRSKLIKLINWHKAWQLLFASLPGTILASYLHDSFWFGASLIAVCSIIPLGTAYKMPWITLIHATFIYILSILYTAPICQDKFTDFIETS